LQFIATWHFSLRACRVLVLCWSAGAFFFSKKVPAMLLLFATSAWRAFCFFFTKSVTSTMAQHLGGTLKVNRRELFKYLILPVFFQNSNVI